MTCNDPTHKPAVALIQVEGLLDLVMHRMENLTERSVPAPGRRLSTDSSGSDNLKQNKCSFC